MPSDRRLAPEPPPLVATAGRPIRPLSVLILGTEFDFPQGQGREHAGLPLRQRAWSRPAPTSGSVSLLQPALGPSGDDGPARAPMTDLPTSTRVERE